MLGDLICAYWKPIKFSLKNSIACKLAEIDVYFASVKDSVYTLHSTANCLLARGN